jgi:Zn-dependent peptidase ImmA (M78 family)/DNA-binding XRE family transcriptional regulator
MADDEMSWTELGQRIAEARRVAGLSQEQLGQPLGLDRSAISRIESGGRHVDTLELSRLAANLERPIEWFVGPRPATVVSRKAALEKRDTTRGDLVLDDLVAEVGMLLELGFLEGVAGRRPARQGPFRGIDDAERLARGARAAAGHVGGPVVDVIELAERLGLLVFVLDVKGAGFDGSFVALPNVGVALVPGDLPPGKRRFTIAHELGHHLLEDEYDIFVDDSGGRQRRESLVDALAAGLLMPGEAVRQRFGELVGAGLDRRAAALHLGREYSVSWTALCGRLVSLGLVDRAGHRRLAADVPSKAEFLELGLRLPPEHLAPVLPGCFIRAVLGAFRARKLSEARALEMLRGTVEAGDLPALRPVPLDTLRSEVDRV